MTLACLITTIRDSLTDLNPVEIVLHMHPDTLADLRTDADDGATALDFRIVPDANVPHGRWECVAL